MTVRKIKAEEFDREQDLWSNLQMIRHTILNFIGERLLKTGMQIIPPQAPNLFVDGDTA